MDYVESFLGEFQLTGITVRTSNKDGKASEDIGQLWKRFFNENIAEKITSKVSNDIYSAYYDYSGENNGEYTTLIGYKTENSNAKSDNLTTITIPKAKYAVINAKGKLPESVVEAWNFVYQENFDRAFTGDFDFYSSDVWSSENPEVLIHVAIDEI